jgi:zinc transporter
MAEQLASTFHGYHFEGEQKPKPLVKADITADIAKNHLTWVHWNFDDPEAHDWVQKHLNLTPFQTRWFCNAKTHPKFTQIEDSFILGIHWFDVTNPNPLHSTHFFFSENLVVSISGESPPSILKLQADIENNQAPSTTDDFVNKIFLHMSHYFYESLDQMEEKVDILNRHALSKSSKHLRELIANLRRDIISTRQYFSPEQDAFLELCETPITWLSSTTKTTIKMLAHQLSHILSGIDSALQRAAITQEELATNVTAQLDRRMFMLAIVATIFLPLSFLAGLFGVNLGGIPGAKYEWAFTIFCAVCLGIGLFGIIPLIMLIRKKQK